MFSTLGVSRWKALLLFMSCAVARCCEYLITELEERDLTSAAPVLVAQIQPCPPQEGLLPKEAVQTSVLPGGLDWEPGLCDGQSHGVRKLLTLLLSIRHR